MSALRRRALAAIRASFQHVGGAGEPGVPPSENAERVLKAIEDADLDVLPSSSAPDVTVYRLDEDHDFHLVGDTVSVRTVVEYVEGIKADRDALAEILGDVWLYIDWRYVTKQLTTAQKERFADAVDATSEEPPVADRWWRP